METLSEHRISAAAPAVFIIVVACQFLSKWLEQLKKRGPVTVEETRLRREIKELSKEASSLSQPATFALAAKLRRIATAKEKELAKHQELHGKEIKGSYNLYLNVLFIFKVLTYLVLVCWFWRVPVASISQQLVQPFENVISWRSGEVLNGNVMVNKIGPYFFCSCCSILFLGELLQLPLCIKQLNDLTSVTSFSLSFSAFLYLSYKLTVPSHLSFIFMWLCCQRL